MTVRDIQAPPALWRMAPAGLPFGRNDVDTVLQRPAEIDIYPGAGTYTINSVEYPFEEVLTFTGPEGRTYTNSEGDVVSAGLDEPRTGHNVWEGGQLVADGIAVCSEERTNLAIYSENLVNWPSDNGATVTQQGTLGGAPAFLISDQTDSYGRVNQNVGPLGDGEFTCQMRVAKTGAQENAFGFRVTFTADGVVQLPGLSFDTETGAVINSWNARVIEKEVNDCGDYWLAWFSFDTTGIGANDVKVQVFPAHNRLGGVATSTLTGTHRCTAFHVNDGRYPQDYIKTEAAPVTLTGETIQIDPVTLVDAVGVFGTELVVNSDGSDGTAGWYGRYAGDIYENVVSSVDGRLRSTLSDGSDGNPAIIQEITGLTIGQTYSVSGSAYISPEASGGYFRVTEQSDLGNGIPFQEYISGGDEVDGLFVATSTTMYLGVVSLTGSIGGYAEIEDLTVRSVTMPSALSIAVQGRMTYEDDGINPQVRMVLCQADASNRIRLQINTTDVRTGQAVAFSQSGGVANSALAAADAYEPGLDVAFSIAMLCSADTVNAAHEGTLFSEASTAGLPNLMGSALQIATTFTGTIYRIRVWAHNIGDANLVEYST